MSADYPNREDWLAIRNRVIPPPRYIHLSGYGRASRRMMPPLTPAGTTYNVGRNAAKRAKRRRA